MDIGQGTISMLLLHKHTFKAFKFRVRGGMLKLFCNLGASLSFLLMAP